MNKQSGIARGSIGTLTVLSVSPLEEDHACLRAIVGCSMGKLFQTNRILSALSILQQHEIAVVLCEQELLPGTWIHMLENIRQVMHPPYLIVTSKLADERLWAEALNLGAWDVLAKPFDRLEVIRSVTSAWQHWHDQIQPPQRPTNVMTAAG